MDNKDTLHIRNSIRRIDQSIDELQKAKAVLIGMLPRKKVDTSSFTFTLPNGKVFDCKGNEVSEGKPKK